ncbi:type II toxin-antitoxin system HicB family antitoxin [Actinomycetospora rhizophila]|uniref:Type II toxin-antitoxin system HicB family antitoxin n=1 Tax=Actinomycetospora rhizophila TaxID=1416876 RepID=A0ABV9ZM76_9PSEU
MTGYVVVVERDESGGYSTWSPDLPGCVAAATDYDECLRLMTDAVQMHVEGLREDGDPVPPPTALAALVVPAA